SATFSGSRGTRRGAARSRRAPRRRRSTARLRAAWKSQAEGFSGTPRYFQTSRARHSASWTASSASSTRRRPRIRTSVATIFPASWRKRWSTSAETPLMLLLADQVERVDRRFLAAVVERPLLLQMVGVHEGDDQ